MASLIPWAGGRLDVWDPFDITSGWLWDTGNRRRQGDRDDPTALVQINVDWRETEDAHIIRAEIPGVKREEVKVQVEDGNILQISGERTKEEEEENDRWHRVERRRGSFIRRFKLQENADLENIQCNLENGVLTVRVPKKQPSTARNVRNIDITPSGTSSETTGTI